MEFLNNEYFGNSLIDYLYFLTSFIIGLLLIIPFRLLLSKLLFRLFGKSNDKKDNEKFNSLLKKTFTIFFNTYCIIYFSTVY